MPSDLPRISGSLQDPLREAQVLLQSGEFGEPLREVLTFAHDLVALANEALAANPKAGEAARVMTMQMAEQLAGLGSRGTDAPT